jgi:hypothetical protein
MLAIFSTAVIVWHLYVVVRHADLNIQALPLLGENFFVGVLVQEHI